MTSEDYNPTDPEFLLSRDLDGDLSEEERRMLDEALAGSESLRAEREKLRAADTLVSSWAARSPQLDWATQAKLVQADVAGETDDEALQKVDSLLTRWGRRTEGIGGDAFTAAVMARIAPPRRRPALQRLIFRVGVPIAAAALIAVAVTGRFWFTVSQEPAVKVVIGPAAPMRSSMDGGPGPRTVVSFAQTASEPRDTTPEPPGISYMTLGSSPMVESWEYSAPL